MKIPNPRLAAEHIEDILAVIQQHKADVVAGRKEFGQFDLTQYGIEMEPHSLERAVLRRYNQASADTRQSDVNMDFVALNRMIRSRVRSRLYYLNLVDNFRKGSDTHEED